MKKNLLNKIFALTLILILAVSLTACNQQSVNTNGNTTNSSNEIESTSASSEVQTTSTTKATQEVETTINNSKPSEKENIVTTSPPEATQKVETTTPTKAQNSTSKKEQPTSSKATNPKTSSKISKAEAKQLALKDAGVRESSIYDLEIELDYDHGVLHYDVSFEVGGKDYDYEINAKTGKFISIDKPKAVSSKTKISKTQAKNIVLKDANVKSNDVTNYRIELEKDDGVWEYEISFRVGRIEYEYTVNAENGKIIEREKDVDD